MNYRLFLKTILFLGALISFVLIYILFLRPDIFWSAEEKVLRLSSWDLDGAINEDFKQLQEKGTILNGVGTVYTEQHIFNIVRLYHDTKMLCVLYTVETPASNKWQKWFPTLGKENRATKSRQVSTIRLTDGIGTEYLSFGINSSTDAIQTASAIACYSAPLTEIKTLYITIGDSDVAEKHANFEIRLTAVPPKCLGKSSRVFEIQDMATPYPDSLVRRYGLTLPNPDRWQLVRASKRPFSVAPSSTFR